MFHPIIPFSCFATPDVIDTPIFRIHIRHCARSDMMTDTDTDGEGIFTNSICRSSLAMMALSRSEVTRDPIHLLRNHSRSALGAACVGALKEVAQAEGIPANSAASADPAR